MNLHLAVLYLLDDFHFEGKDHRCSYPCGSCIHTQAFLGDPEINVNITE
jgi:hypothetical protein